LTVTDPAPEPEPPAIQVEALTKRYGRLTAIRDVSFQVQPGQVVGFVGPNGAGKSTTLRILCGLMPASSGAAFVQGLPVATQASQIRHRIGFLQELNPLPEDLRVGEYLWMRASLKEVPRRERKRRIHWVLDRLEINPRDRRKVIGTLSKGYRQRVGLADTLLARPPIIILDEPTIGLDPRQVQMIRDLVASLRGKATVLISSHILSELQVCCDAFIILNRGRVITSGTLTELRRRYLREQRYELEVRGSEAEIAAALAEVDPGSSPIERRERLPDGYRRVFLRFPHEGEMGEALLREFGRRPGLTLRSLQPHQPDLEDVFLAATEPGRGEAERKDGLNVEVVA
jgi:ABC-2 type transport system ATP-binding protein